MALLCSWSSPSSATCLRYQTGLPQQVGSAQPAFAGQTAICSILGSFFELPQQVGNIEQALGTLCSTVRAPKALLLLCCCTTGRQSCTNQRHFSQEHGSTCRHLQRGVLVLDCQPALCSFASAPAGSIATGCLKMAASLEAHAGAAAWHPSWNPHIVHCCSRRCPDMLASVS